MSDDLITTDAAEVLDIPAPNEGEEGTLMEGPGAKTAIARWYAVQVASSCEKKVKATLEQRAVTLGVSNRILEIEIPQTPAVKLKKDGTRQSTEEKVFPGYVLVQMNMNDDTWHLVKSVPKVMGFIGGNPDKPAPITDAEADAILQRVQDGTEKPRPKVLFEPGEVVRVIDGPFNDFNGVVEEVNYEKSRLRVAVLIFGRSTPVELEFGQVEKD